jgi:hypothetical protein
VQTLAERRLALGLYTLLPLDDFMRASAFYPDEREQFFSNSLHPELYSDRLSAASIAFGAGGRLSDSLSLGLALTLAIKSGARAPAYVSNLSDLDTLLLDSDVGVSVSFAPHAALSYQPYERLRLSGTVHSPQAVDIETRVSYIIATGLEQRAEQTFTHAYLPWIFGLGAEFAFGPAAVPHWSAVASAQYALWSQYRDRHGVRPTAPYAFRNVLGASIGMRYTSAGLSGLIDVVFQPSPVPPQRGRSNYVDNDRAGLALAASYAFSLWGHGAELGLATQLHRLLSQAVRKLPGTSVDSVRDELPDDAIGGTPRGPIIGREGLQTNNPGFPGFSSGGFLFGAGLHFKVAY